MLLKNRLRRPRPKFVKDLQLLGYEKIIGVDEVGRGALAGPLVVAAVEIYRQILGINDSKLLSAQKRELLASQISYSALQISFGLASNDEIDQLGLATAQRLAYRRCLAGAEFDLVLSDDYGLKPIIHFRAVKGDSLFYPVAAASIVAKVYRDQLMRESAEKFPNYFWHTNVGYGTLEHKIALDTIGPSSMHRKSFLTKKDSLRSQSSEVCKPGSV